MCVCVCVQEPGRGLRHQDASETSARSRGRVGQCGNLPSVRRRLWRPGASLHDRMCSLYVIERVLLCDRYWWMRSPVLIECVLSLARMCSLYTIDRVLLHDRMCSLT